MATDLEITEYDALRNEIRQRSTFQHGYFLVNIASTGTLLTVAIGSDWLPALLVLPILSFSLFMLWIHQGLSIQHIGDHLMSRFRSRWQEDMFVEPSVIMYRIRVITFIFGLLSNFLGAPLVGLVLYVICSPAFNPPLAWLFALDVLLIVTATVIFVLVYRSMYWQRHRVSEAQKSERQD
jgi:hypothetical protein